MSLELVTRCRAELVRVIDGDTYILLCDLEQRSSNTRASAGTVSEEGAATIRVRLRDYSCPEKKTAAGKAAMRAAHRLLADEALTVEFLGEDTIGRLVGWIWVGPDDLPLGPELERRGHARPGAFIGRSPSARPSTEMG